MNKCYRCGGMDTTHIATSEDESAVVYCGWCNPCKAPFSYRMRVDIVYDQEGRI